MLTFIADRFAWEPFSKTLPDADEVTSGDAVRDAVVTFLHFEAKDEADDERRRVLRHALKHLKWIANKRELQVVVLHSFTHLGGTNAGADFALGLMQELAERLSSTGYETRITPFGYFCSWELAVRGESLAKVWKEV